MQQVLAEINRQKYPCTHLKFLKDGFEGVYLLTEADTLHFTFGVPAPINEYQMTIVFHDTFCDVLAFPHPTIILPDYIQASEQVTNCINGYVKKNEVKTLTNILQFQDTVAAYLNCSTN